MISAALPIERICRVGSFVILAVMLARKSCELSEDAPKALFVPKGFARGFVTLEDGTA